MKNLIVFIIFFSLTVCLFPIVPGYFGARSLSLGYSTTAYNFNVNAIFINPALLAKLKYSSTGYQYQNSYMDYKNFTTDLNEIIDYDLKNYESIPESEKSVLFSKLNDLFRAKSGIYGFSASVPGFASKGYGISISVFKTAIINPVENDIFLKEAESVTNADIASLRMNFLGLNYKQVSLSYAFPFSQGVNVGIGIHYLNGKLTEYKKALVDDLFPGNSGADTYLEDCWGEADEKFSKIVMDIGVSANFGDYFNVGINMRNVGGAKINTGNREIGLNKRVTAGLAFTPDVSWGIYLDMDIKRTDLLYSGKKMQPISLGLEKGFFKNKLFLRTGFLTDLTEKYFIGTGSNVLYGLGFGFNIGYIIVDFGLGVDGSGSVNNLALSGFFMKK